MTSVLFSQALTLRFHYFIVPLWIVCSSFVVHVCKLQGHAQIITVLSLRYMYVCGSLCGYFTPMRDVGHNMSVHTPDKEVCQMWAKHSKWIQMWAQPKPNSFITTRCWWEGRDRIRTWVFFFILDWCQLQRVSGRWSSGLQPHLEVKWRWWKVKNTGKIQNDRQ